MAAGPWRAGLTTRRITMKRLSSRSGRTLRLAKETVRSLLSNELSQVAAAAGPGCPSLNGCSHTRIDTLNQCDTIFCSMMQY
jgi:hypothetical protein